LLQADDDEGDVVQGAAGDVEAGQQRVGQLVRGEDSVLGQGSGQAGQAGVDVLVAAFDEAVGVSTRVPPPGCR
jgi:hypothetical protein